MLRNVAIAIIPVMLVATPAAAVTSRKRWRPARSAPKASSWKAPSATLSSRSAWRRVITSPLQERTPNKLRRSNQNRSRPARVSGGARHRPLQWRHFELAQCTPPQNIDRYAPSNSLTVKQPDEIVHAGDWRRRRHPTIVSRLINPAMSCRPIRLECIDHCPRTIFDFRRHAHTALAPRPSEPKRR